MKKFRHFYFRYFWAAVKGLSWKSWSHDMPTFQRLRPWKHQNWKNQQKYNFTSRINKKNKFQEKMRKFFPNYHIQIKQSKFSRKIFFLVLTLIWVILRPTKIETEITVWDLRPSYFKTVLGLRPKTKKTSVGRSSRGE